MSNEYLESPKGEIQFLALNRKVTKDLKKDSVGGYAIRLKFDSATKEGAEWKKKMEAINTNLVGTKHTDTKTEFTIRAFSQFLPIVMNANGDLIDEGELPNFYATSKGVASILIVPYLENPMGGSINLSGIVIHQLEEGEKPEGEGGGGGAREAVLARLKEMMGK